MVTKIPSSMLQRGLPAQYLTGFRVSLDPSNPAKRVAVAPGECRAQTDNADIRLAAGMMKRLDQNWAQGDGGGGLDTGALAASSWYHLHLMTKTSTGEVDILASRSFTNPLFPAGWEASPRRRVGSVYADQDANLAPFVQTDDYCEWLQPASDASSINIGAAATLIRVRVPDGMKTEGRFLILVSTAGGNGTGNLGLADPDGGDPTLFRTYMATQKPTTTNGVTVQVTTPTDVNGRVMAFAEANMTASILTLGYWDRRGRV
ncbi:hypothetical protein ACU8KI_08960 [Rhizobium leguminosarum]